MEARAEGVVVEKRGKLRIWLDGAFVLEIADLEVEAFDLAVQLRRETVSVSKKRTFSRWLGKGDEREGNLPATRPSRSSPLFPLERSAPCRSWP